VIGVEQKIDIEKLSVLDIEKELNTTEERIERMQATPSNVWQEHFWIKVLPYIRILVCIGDMGTGKTALSFKILEYAKKINKKVCVFKWPNREDIEKCGYMWTDDIDELFALNDAILYIDEPQWTVGGKHEKRLNEHFEKMMTLTRQKNITIILSTFDTRWINLSLEGSVSHWIIKSIELDTIKRTSYVKKIIKEIYPIAYKKLILPKNQYLFYSKYDGSYNGLHSFKKPSYFTDKFSCAFRREIK
jgi:hypothetical protein